MNDLVRKPPVLKKGDIIGIVAPSRMIFPEQLDRANQVFKDWGLQVKYGNNLFSRHGYFAGTDDQRLEDLQSMINDEEVKAVFCARGGYGMTRIIDEVDLSSLKESPKWIIGYSDITALHLKMAQIGIESVHGLMPVQFAYEGVEKSLDSLHNLLFSDQLNYTLPGNPANKMGSATATIIGGNLSLVVESLGTATEIDTKNKILFLEEIDEYLYKIDRMMMQLKRADKFQDLKGVIIGDFSDPKDTQIPFGKGINELITSFFNEYEIPVVLNFPAGHEPYNLALSMGREVHLEVMQEQVNLYQV